MRIVLLLIDASQPLLLTAIIISLSATMAMVFVTTRVTIKHIQNFPTPIEIHLSHTFKLVRVIMGKQFNKVIEVMCHPYLVLNSTDLKNNKSFQTRKRK